MNTIASQITSLTIIYSTVYSGADQIKHQSSASLAFVRGIHRWPVNSPHKGPVTRKMFPFDDVIMWYTWLIHSCSSGLLHWQWGNQKRGNLLIAPVPVKEPWRTWLIWVHHKTRQSTNRVNVFIDILQVTVLSLKRLCFIKEHSKHVLHIRNIGNIACSKWLH